MVDETLINPYPLQELKLKQAYWDSMNHFNRASFTDDDHYNIQYNHSMIDSDNVNDSIKVKILYNELMKLKTDFDNSKRSLIGKINDLIFDNKWLVEENKKLSDEVASIKQALYFG